MYVIANIIIIIGIFSCLYKIPSPLQKLQRVAGILKIMKRRHKKSSNPQEAVFLLSLTIRQRIIYLHSLQELIKKYSLKGHLMMILI